MEYVPTDWVSTPAEHVAARRYNGPLPGRLKTILKHDCADKAHLIHTQVQARLMTRLAGETLRLMGLRRGTASCLAAALDSRLEQLSHRLSAYRRDAVRLIKPAPAVLV